MKTSNSQKSATLAEENLVLFSMGDGEIVTLTEDNKLQRWVRNDDFAGFVIKRLVGLLLSFGTQNYEFVESFGSITQKQREACFTR